MATVSRRGSGVNFPEDCAHGGRILKLMDFQIARLHPTFAAEITGLDVRAVTDAATLERLRAAMDTYAVCVIRDQRFEDDEQVAFAKRFDGELHTKTGRNAVDGERRRLASREMTDVANLDEYGNVLGADDSRRIQGLANRR